VGSPTSSPRTSIMFLNAHFLAGEMSIPKIVGISCLSRGGSSLTKKISPILPL